MEPFAQFISVAFVLLLSCRPCKGATLISRTLVPIDVRMPQTSGAKDAVIAVRHDLLASRVLVPLDARIPQTSGAKDGVIAVRHDLLASRVLVPIDARMPQTSGERDAIIAVRHDLLLSRSLVPADAQLRAAKAIGTFGLSPGAVRQDVFEESLLDKAWNGHERKPVDWLISLGIHIGIVAVVLILPLFFTQAVDLSRFENTYLAASPPLGPPPPPPPGAAVAHPQQERPKPNLSQARLVAPMLIPKTVEISRGVAEIPSESTFAVRGGEAGGVPGGQIGGVLEGVFGGTGLSAPPPPPPPPPTAASKLLHVGGEVKAPRGIYKLDPEYPLLAKQGRVQGVVEIDAVIDERGNVTQMRAVSGPGLLIDAALKAVRMWKYEPTYLNGEAYPVEMTIHVSFRLP